MKHWRNFLGNKNLSKKGVSDFYEKVIGRESVTDFAIMNEKLLSYVEACLFELATRYFERRGKLTERQIGELDFLEEFVKLLMRHKIKIAQRERTNKIKSLAEEV